MADVIETLAKLKPARPDRDAILFAAGRASGRRAPAWKLLVAGLAVQQALLLGIWFSPEQRGEVVYPKEAEAPPPIPESAPPETPTVPFDRSATLWNLEAESTQPVPTASVVPEEHWTARTPIRFD